jgi:cytochrome c oxidase cbb3-type subunit 2
MGAGFGRPLISNKFLIKQGGDSVAFREYRIGCWMFGVALSLSMFITIVLPGLDISSMSSTKIALEKQLTYGWETGFNYYDPFFAG